MYFKKDSDKAKTSQQMFNDILADAKSRAEAATTALSDYQMAARIGTVTIRTFRNAEKALKDLQFRHEQLPALIVDNQTEQRKLREELANGEDGVNAFGVSLQDLVTQLPKLQTEFGMATAKEKAFEEVLESMGPKVEFARQAMTGAELAAKQMGAEIESTAFANALLEKTQEDLKRALDLGIEGFDGSSKELKLYEAKLRGAVTGLKMMEKAEGNLMSLTFKEDLEGQRKKVAELTATVKGLREAQGLKTKAIVDRESLTMMRDAKTEMTTLHGTVQALNAIGAFTPGSPMITGLELAKEKVKILEDSLGDLMEKAVEKAAELPGGLSEALMLPEFAEQLAFITENLIHFNDQIAAEEPFELAKEHWDDWKENAGDAILHVAEAWTGFLDDFTSGWGDAVGRAIVDGESFSDAMKEVWNNMLRNFIGAIAEMIAQWILSQIFTVTTASAAHSVLRANALELIYLNAYAGAAFIPGAGNIAGMAAVMGALAGAGGARGAGSVAGGGLDAANTFTQPAALPLAHGGIVTNPTLALIGEAGPEAVVPLSGRHGLGGSQHINLYMDGQLITETVLRNMPEEVRVNIGGAI